MANLVTIVVQLPPLVVRALEDLHKLVSALLNSTVLDDVHKIASALHDKDLRADLKCIASALNNEDLRADIHNVGTALTDENLLESIGRLAVVSHQLRSELEPVLGRCHSFSAVRTRLSSWATRSPRFWSRRTRWSTWSRDQGSCPDAVADAKPRPPSPRRSHPARGRPPHPPTTGALSFSKGRFCLTALCHKGFDSPSSERTRGTVSTTAPRRFPRVTPTTVDITLVSLLQHMT